MVATKPIVQMVQIQPMDQIVATVPMELTPHYAMDQTAATILMVMELILHHAMEQIVLPLHAMEQTVLHRPAMDQTAATLSLIHI